MTGCSVAYDGSDDLIRKDRVGLPMPGYMIEALDAGSWRWHVYIEIESRLGDAVRFDDFDVPIEQWCDVDELGEIIHGQSLECAKEVPSAFTPTIARWKAVVKG